jgi:hypothetical protein
MRRALSVSRIGADIIGTDHAETSEGRFEQSGVAGELEVKG